MTEKNNTFVDTTKVRPQLTEDAKKAFEPKFSKLGISTEKFGFVSWTGLKIAAGQEVAEGTLTGQSGEGDFAGQTIVTLDAEAFERVAKRVLSHRESNPKPERDSRPTGPKPIDLRKQLANRLELAFSDLREKQARAEDNGWGVNYSELLGTLEQIATDAERLIIGSENAEAIKVIHNRLDALKYTDLKNFEEGPVLRDRIKAAEHGFSQLEGSVSSTTASTIRTALDQVTAAADSGDSRKARNGLYGEDGVFAMIGRVRGVASAKTAEPERRRNQGRNDRNQRQTNRPPVRGGATIGERVAASQRDSRR